MTRTLLALALFGNFAHAAVVKFEGLNLDGGACKVALTVVDGEVTAVNYEGLRTSRLVADGERASAQGTEIRGPFEFSETELARLPEHNQLGVFDEAKSSVQFSAGSLGTSRLRMRISTRPRNFHMRAVEKDGRTTTISSADCLEMSIGVVEGNRCDVVNNRNLREACNGVRPPGVAEAPGTR